VVEDLAGRGLVDGVGDALAQLLELAAEGLEQGFRGERGEGVHRGSGPGTRRRYGDHLRTA